MIYIPPELQVLILLEPGRVYLFKADHHKGSKLHYHVIVNTDPSSDERIVMVTATSISLKHMDDYWSNLVKLGVIVQATSEDADFIQHPTLFRCDEPIVLTKQQINNKISEGLLIQKEAVPEKLLTRLRDGLLNSDTVEEEIKKLVR